MLQRTFEAEESLELLAAEKVSWALCWPHQWGKLEGAANWGQGGSRLLCALAPRTPPLRCASSLGTDWESLGSFGTSETFTMFSIFAWDTPPEIKADAAGFVLPGNTLKIVDPLSGEIVPLGERGEIAVKGPTLMLGYLGIPREESLDAGWLLPHRRRGLSWTRPGASSGRDACPTSSRPAAPTSPPARSTA